MNGNREEPVAKGIAIIDEERCKGCGLCIEACPQGVLSFSGRLNRSGYNVTHAERPDDCIGCGFCAITCPDVAIEVYREKVAA